MARKPQNDPKAKPRVEAVERALSLLEAFDDGVVQLPLKLLAERSGLYPSTVLRLAASLEAFGFLQRGADGMFRLGPSLWRLGNHYMRAFDLEPSVRPVLGALVEELGETAAFYIRAGEDRLCLFRCHADNRIGHHMQEGGRLPLDGGASANVLLAFSGAEGARFDEIRRSGVDVSRGERMPDVHAVAAPVFGARAELLGVIAVSGPGERLRGEGLERAIAAVVGRAGRLTQSFRGR